MRTIEQSLSAFRCNDLKIFKEMVNDIRMTPRPEVSGMLSRKYNGRAIQTFKNASLTLENDGYSIEAAIQYLIRNEETRKLIDSLHPRCPECEAKLILMDVWNLNNELGIKGKWRCGKCGEGELNSWQTVDEFRKWYTNTVEKIMES